MKRPIILTDPFCRNIRKPGRYGDNRGGYGLSLLVRVRKNGRVAKYWTQEVRVRGRKTSLGLGVYPIVTLAEARRRALANRQAVEEGRDPRASRIPTFERAAEKVIALHSPQWKGGLTEKHWRSSLGRFAFPVMGHKPVDQITPADVMAALSPIWHKKPTMAQKTRRRISAVMRWAMAQGFRPDDPSSAAAAALGNNRNGGPKHHRALPHSEVAEALRLVDCSAAWWGTKAALGLLVATACRSGEVRLARWEEIDREAAVWTIPAERTKTGKPHRVPLSEAALRALEAASARSGSSGLCFPSPRGKALSDATMSVLLKRLGVAAVPHGFRSSFRDWCSETGVRREVAEQALSHVVGGVEGAYHRTDLLEERRPVMAAWGEYLSL